MPIPALAIAVTPKNPVDILLELLEKHQRRCPANTETGVRCALCGITEHGAHRLGPNMVNEARAAFEALVLPDVYLHLEPPAVAMLKTLLESGLYGGDLEEVCIRLICEGLERRIDGPHKNSGTGVRLTMLDE